MQILRADTPFAIRMLISAPIVGAAIALAVGFVSLGAGLAADDLTYAAIAVATTCTITVGIIIWQRVGQFPLHGARAFALAIAAAPSVALLLWPGSTTTLTAISGTVVLVGAASALLTATRAPRVSVVIACGLALMEIATIAWVVHLSAWATANAIEATHRAQSFAILPTGITLGAVIAALLMQRAPVGVPQPNRQL